MKFLSILATFKNEESILKEWIDHHLQQGFDHLYLINNGSTDNFLDVLSPYIANKLVTLYNLPQPYNRVNNYNYVFNIIKENTEWLAVCDVDDYWYTPTGNIREFIEESNKQAWDAIVTFATIKGCLAIEQPTNIFKQCNLELQHNVRIRSIARTSKIDIVNHDQHLLKSLAVIRFEQTNICITNYKETSLERFLHTRLYRSHPDRQDMQRNWSDFWLQLID